MFSMDQIKIIREMYNKQGMNISEIARETGYDWKTVRKYIDKDDFNEPIPTADEAVICPKLEPFKPLIDQWLMDDKKAPRKQRHTAKRVYKRLKEEVDDFNCSYRLVAEYVKEKKKEMNMTGVQGNIPLEHAAGEAQADFGAADYYERGLRHSGKYFVLDFPYSNQGYLQLHGGENLECLLESMRNIFEFIGGVPREIWFDNTRTIVTKIIRGGNRKTNERFDRFCEHYGFEPIFTNPDAGNEKGGVESKVGYDRRNMLVPVPRFIDLKDFNQHLLQLCEADGDREHYRFKGEYINERFEAEKKALLSLPETPFNTDRYVRVRTNKWGKFTLNKGKHTYSASPGMAVSEILVRLSAETVTVLDKEMNEVSVHRRLYGDEYQESMQWLPYLRYIATKPRSLRNSGIYDMMPENMQAYLDSCMNSERGKILKMLSDMTDRSGFESALQTINQAIIYQATDADSLNNLHRRLYSDVPQMVPLSPQTGIPSVEQMSSGVMEYDRLLERRM